MTPGAASLESSASGRALDHLLFLRRFLRHPVTVGAVAPSSRVLAHAMLAHVTWKPGIRIAELGPGTGPFTALIASRLPQHGRYLGIDRDPIFARHVQARWPHLECVCDSASRLLELARERDLIPLDHVISGIPFAGLSSGTTRPILDAVEASLGPGGSFTTFQYLHAFNLPLARAFRAEVGGRFGAPTGRALTVRNVPPAFVLTWRKRR